MPMEPCSLKTSHVVWPRHSTRSVIDAPDVGSRLRTGPYDCPCDGPKQGLRSPRQPNRLIGEAKETEGFTRTIDDVREADFRLANCPTRRSGSQRFDASSWSVGSIWDKSGPPSFAHACQRTRELRLASHAKDGVLRSAQREGGPPELRHTASTLVDSWRFDSARRLRMVAPWPHRNVSSMCCAA